MSRWLLVTAGSAVAVVVSLALPGVAAAPRPTTTAKASTPARLASLLAAGKAGPAAKLLCRSGVAFNGDELGQVLAEADSLVLGAGATSNRIDRFDTAVARAYERAEVRQEAAGESFAVGLSVVLRDYAGSPTSPASWGHAQAAIGAGIIRQAATEWAADPMPGAPCS